MNLYAEFVELHCCFLQHSNASSSTQLHILRTFAIFVYFALVPSHALGASTSRAATLFLKSGVWLSRKENCQCGNAHISNSFCQTSYCFLNTLKQIICLDDWISIHWPNVLRHFLNVLSWFSEACYLSKGEAVYFIIEILMGMPQLFRFFR